MNQSLAKIRDYFAKKGVGVRVLPNTNGQAYGLCGSCWSFRCDPTIRRKSTTGKYLFWQVLSNMDVMDACRGEATDFLLIPDETTPVLLEWNKEDKNQPEIKKL